jgi:hypothetical protein
VAGAERRKHAAAHVGSDKGEQILYGLYASFSVRTGTCNSASRRRRRCPAV